MLLAHKIAAVYLAVVSIISVIVCIYDKIASKTQNVKLRTPEKKLLFFSLIGGSVAMFITMLLIRHKTKHAKFMLGIPAIIILQVAAAVAVMYFF